MSTVAEPVPDETEVVAAKPPFIRRVRIRGYKSIAFCDVTLEPLTILVGQNASGKSNFVDALGFIRDLLGSNLTEASKRHGGWRSIQSKTERTQEFAIELELNQKSSDSGVVVFGLTFREGPKDTLFIRSEWLRTSQATGPEREIYSRSGTYEPSKQSIEYRWNSDPAYLECSKVPAPHPDQVWLSALPTPYHQSLFDDLKAMAVYTFDPKQIRVPQAAMGRGYLDHDGSNLAAVLETMGEAEPWAIERVNQYLGAITRSVAFEEIQTVGGYKALHFLVDQGKPSDGHLEFDANSMSDGTLRAFAALVAAFQVLPPRGAPSLIAIEEPETSLHPAAAGALVSALEEASGNTQVVVTTHSVEMLNHSDVKPEYVRVVEMVEGATVITPLDDVTVEIIRDNFGTLGGLERDRQLILNESDQARQMKLAGRAFQ